MQPANVVLLLGVGLLVALSVVALGLPDGRAPDLDGLGKRLLRTRVRSGEVKNGDCVAHFAPAAPCALTIDPSNLFVRRLEISTTDQVQISFSPAAIDKQVELKLTWNFDKKDVDLVIDRGGAKLQFSCVQALPTTPPRACAVNLTLLESP